MSKKIKPTATRLSKCFEQNNADEKRINDSIGIITSKNNLEYPVSFRLTAEDIDKLNKIVKEVNGICRIKIKKSKVLQALIHCGSNMPIARFIKELKEIL